LAISTVIFDMGGVIVWTHWEHATEPLGRAAGMAPEQVLETVLNSDTHLAYMRGEIDTGEFASSVAASLDIKMPADELMGHWNSILAPNLEALPLLERVKGKHRLVLGSNTDEEHYKRSAELQPALALFADTLLSYELGHCKPDTAFFTSGLEVLGVSPDECVFIDDVAENIESATSLGITGIRFESMAQVELELETLGLFRGAP